MREAYIKIWKDRIVEIKSTGNCKNKIGQDYFSSKHDIDRMIFYCEGMIDRLNKKK